MALLCFVTDLDESADAIGGEAWTTLEVAIFDCFAPFRYGWIAYSGVVEFDELGAVLAFVHVVCKEIW